MILPQRALSVVHFAKSLDSDRSAYRLDKDAIAIRKANMGCTNSFFVWGLVN
jgi:hypothetical protein